MMYVTGSPQFQGDFDDEDLIYSRPAFELSNTEEVTPSYEQTLANMLKSKMGVNPFVSIGVPVVANSISALIANNARKKLMGRLSALKKPSLPQFRFNPLLSQRIAQQQQLADQPMMGYQRAMDEQTARQMERGRQVAAGLGGGAGLAYMQGVSSSIGDQQRQGVLTDMQMQRQNRAALDQLIALRNQELQQQRAMEMADYQYGLQDYFNQRENLTSDLSQQRGNIARSLGQIVSDIPSYIQNVAQYRGYQKMMEELRKKQQNQGQ
jgi:hypothetical protein